MKHLKSRQDLNEASENLNISDVMKSLSVEEQEMIQKGKTHWSLDILSKRRGGYVDSKTIKELIDKVIAEIRISLENGDVTALEELLKSTPENNLIAYLPEEEQPKYILG